MRQQIKKRLIRTSIFCALALAIGAGIGWMETKLPTNASLSDSATLAGVKLGGPFTLIDQDGKKVTEKNFARKYELIYFGFTSCPAVCPTELRKMTLALNAMGADADKIQPIFITVDPARDDVKTMKGYVSLFHPRLIGLTGTQKEIDDVAHSYKVYASKVPEEGGDYTMSHSSFIYFMRPDGETLALYQPDDNADFMARDMREKLRSY